jgi:hypothetical protein
MGNDEWYNISDQPPCTNYSWVYDGTRGLVRSKKWVYYQRITLSTNRITRFLSCDMPVFFSELKKVLDH